MSVRHIFRAAGLIILGWLVCQTSPSAPTRVSPAPPPGVTEFSGVIDRIVDRRQAVILVEDAEWELPVAAAALPPNARAGSWVIVRQDDRGGLVITVDESRTQAALKRIQEKLHALKARGCAQTCP